MSEPIRAATAMDTLLGQRLKAIKQESIRDWANRMILEWSKNEETSMTIVSLAHYYDRLVELEQEAATAEPVIETGNGSLKKNPVFAMLDNCQTKIIALSRKLNIEPDVVFDGEEYE
jgi:hypothetical protein